MVVLIASLSVHEAAHAWAAHRLGDPTAQRLGRLSLNPAVHVDPVGTLVFPLIAMLTRLPLIGWAKPVPVDPRFLKHPKRDFAIIAAAGPASNIVMAVIGAVAFAAIRYSAPGDIGGRGRLRWAHCRHLRRHHDGGTGRCCGRNSSLRVASRRRGPVAAEENHSKQNEEAKHPA